MDIQYLLHVNNVVLVCDEWVSVIFNTRDDTTCDHKTDVTKYCTYLVVLRELVYSRSSDMINITTRLFTDWYDVTGPTCIPGCASVNHEPTRFIWLKSCCCSPVTIRVLSMGCGSNYKEWVAMRERDYVGPDL